MNNCKSIQKFEIPPLVKSIEYETFNGCTSLAEILIPSSLKKFEKSILGTCPNFSFFYDDNNSYILHKKLSKELLINVSIFKKTLIPNDIIKEIIIRQIGPSMEEPDKIGQSPQSLILREIAYRFKEKIPGIVNSLIKAFEI